VIQGREEERLRNVQLAVVRHCYYEMRPHMFEMRGCATISGQRTCKIKLAYAQKRKIGVVRYLREVKYVCRSYVSSLGSR